MGSQIIIENLHVSTIIGIHDYEREAPQELVINVTADYDFSACIQGDEITHTIDYAALSQSLITFISASDFFLLETLAHHCLTHIFDTTIASQAEISIKKQNVVKHVDAVGVKLNMQRP